MKLFNKPKRQKTTAKYQTLVWSPPLKSIAQPIDSFGRLVAGSLSYWRHHWPTFGLLLILFILGAGFLFWGFGNPNGLMDRQQQLEAVHGDGWFDRLTIATDQLQYLSQQLLQDTDFNFYLVIWLILLSLTTIYARRQLTQKKLKKMSQKLRLGLDSFYFGPGQIIPFVLVLIFITGQLLPMLIANAVATNLRLEGLLDSNGSQLIALSVVVLISCLSIYLASGSIFGLIIATRSGIRPATAWQTAWDLTTHRRAQTAAYLVGGCLLGLATIALIMTPILIFFLSGAAWIFNICLVAVAIWWHLYFFELYQSLIKPPAND